MPTIKRMLKEGFGVLEKSTFSVSLLVFLLCSTSCNQASDSSKETDDGQPKVIVYCEDKIVPSDSDISFGSLSVGESVSKKLTIKNIGNDTLRVFYYQDILLTGTNPEDFRIDIENEYLIEPGNQASFTVFFAPQSQGWKGAGITLQSNDPDHPGITIFITGDSLPENTGEINNPALDFLTDGFVFVKKGITSSQNGSAELTYDIEMAKYEVTIKEYIAFLNEYNVASDGTYKGKSMIALNYSECPIRYDEGQFVFAEKSNSPQDTCPVTYVTMYGARAYCNWLSENAEITKAYNEETWERLESNTNQLGIVKDGYYGLTVGYRLPSAYEWIYAARGGKDGIPTIWAGSNNLNEVAWVNEDYQSLAPTHPVGLKNPNELWIYDMNGNVAELSENDWHVYTGETYFGMHANSILTSYSKIDYYDSMTIKGGGRYMGFRVVRTRP